MSPLGSVVLLGLLVGLDNLQVGAALGVGALSRPRRLAFAASFALFEATMPLVGLVAGAGLRRLSGSVAELLGPTVLAACGVALLVGALRAEPAPDIGNGRAWMVVALPFSLSLDNLLAGAGLGALGFPVALSALVLGALSGTLALLGLALGGRGRELFRVVPPSIKAWSAQAWSGIFLLTLAVVRFV